MQGRIVGVIVVVCLLVSGAVLMRGLSGGLAADTSVMPPMRRGPQNGGIPAAYFKFSATTKQRDNGNASDWQEASTTLTFSDLRDAPGSWSCNVTVGMPLHTEKWGAITAEYAAYVAASTATDAANEVSKTATAAEFCKQWRDGMQKLLGGIQGLGAEVSGSE